MNEILKSLRSISRLALAITILAGLPGMAQQNQPGRGAQAPAAAQTAKARAPIDFTGYWVSVVTEDWRWRMVTPPKGDYISVPLNKEGRRIADSWDLAKDDAAGLQCKAYGAPGIMRIPERLHLTWADDNTLKIETDAGKQVRLLHFGEWSNAKHEATWQGTSIAKWEAKSQLAAQVGAGTTALPPPDLTSSLQVTTTEMRAGYLRKNGVPYSDKAVLSEYFDITNEDNGDTWLVVTSTVDDPQYLEEPFITSTHFKKESDGSKWNPQPCETSRPAKLSLPVAANN